MQHDNTVSRELLGEYCAAWNDQDVTFATPAYHRRKYYLVCIGFIGMACVSLACLFASLMMRFRLPYAAVSVGIVIDLIVAAYLSLSTGVNQIVFHLDGRTYERALFGRTMGDDQAGYPGLGNLRQRMDVDGLMEEIAGVRVWERRVRPPKAYAVQLLWADDADPPMLVGFVGSEEEARRLAAQISTTLGLPVLDMKPKY